MDIMILKNILLVGVPETTLSILLGLVLCNGNIFKNIKGINDWLNFIIKIILSNIIILSIIVLGRQKINNIVLISILSTCTYIMNYLIIWKMNLRQGFFSGSLTSFIVISVDIITFPIVTYLIKITQVHDILIYEYNYVLALPSRVLQLILLWVLLYFNFNIINHIFFTVKWKELTSSKKISLLIILTLIFFSVIFNTNYSNLYVRYTKHQNIELNVILYFIETILYLSLTIILLSRTITYEKYKQLLDKTPPGFIDEILNNSSKDELQIYAKLMIQHLSYMNFYKFEKHIRTSICDNPKINCIIDETLYYIDLNYSSLTAIIDYMIQQALNICNFTSILISVDHNEGTLKTLIQVNTNEFSAFKFTTLLDSDKFFNKLKYDLKLTKKDTLNIFIEPFNVINININIDLYSLIGGALNENKH